MTLSDLEKRAIFKDLATMTRWQAACRAGLDKYYKNKKSAVSMVNLIKNEVLSNPEKFAISHDLIELVTKSLEDRSANKSAISKDLVAEKPQAIEELDVKELVERGSKKALLALNKKVDMVVSSKKILANTPIAALAQVAGILFDKRQIVRGEATEHIALKAKIDTDMTPEEKMAAIQRLRESVISENNG